MGVFDLTKLVLKTLQEKPLRVFLTTFGIFIGIFTFTFFQFAGTGLSQGVENQISSFGLNVLTISSPENSQQNGPPGGGGVEQKTIEELKRIADGYKYISGSIFYSTRYEYGREEESILALAYPDEDLNDIYEDLNVEIAQGRNIRQGDSGVVVLGAKVAQDTFNRELRVGNSISTNGKSFRVVGILEAKDDLFIDSSMRMSFSDIEDLSGQDTFTNVRVSYFQGVDIEAEREKIDSYFNRPNQPKEIEISSPQQTLEQINAIFFTLNIVISVIAGIALVVGGINVMNTMYSNVLERVNEISVQKAMGATNSQIVYMYIVESVILSIVGSIIGYLTSFWVAQILSDVVLNSIGFSFPVVFSWVYFLGAVIATVLFGGFFGAYPAYLAANVNPADNLRDE
ncbi:MAG: ABC transporter permease [Candidatus Nanoarchaeia archaeon]